MHVQSPIFNSFTQSFLWILFVFLSFEKERFLAHVWSFSMIRFFFAYSDMNASFISFLFIKCMELFRNICWFTEEKTKMLNFNWIFTKKRTVLNISQVFHSFCTFVYWSKTCPLLKYKTFFCNWIIFHFPQWNETIEKNFTFKPV